MEEVIKYSGSWEEEIHKIIAEAQSGDKEAKEYVISENIGLVKNIVSKFLSTGYEWEDLYQIGCIGLVKAVDRFDTSFNVRFSTYAVPLIIGEIKRFLRDDGKIKISRDVKTGIKKLKDTEEMLFNKLGRYPKISELAEAMDMKCEDVLYLIEANYSVSNMESIDDTERKDVFFKEPQTNDEDNKIDLITLKELISNMKERDRQIIVLRYFKDMTQQEVADMLNISQVQVSRLEKKILGQLKKNIVV
ncbi:MAG: sigma-70 family RNA polymerase sigma factor [Clostridiales bacterium]|nr:sigma-70 family RNA polymerase sigma factor [Clostridiales bacterium]